MCVWETKHEIKGFLPKSGLENKNFMEHKRGGQVSWLRVEVLERIKCYGVVRRRVGEGCQPLGCLHGDTGSRASSACCSTVVSILMMDHLPDSVGFFTAGMGPSSFHCAR